MSVVNGLAEIRRAKGALFGQPGRAAELYDLVGADIALLLAELAANPMRGTDRHDWNRIYDDAPSLTTTSMADVADDLQIPREPDAGP